jgi:chorismate synthase
MSLKSARIVRKLYLAPMAGNTLGKVFQITTFGESHGLAIGGIIDGIPAGLKIDPEGINSDLKRRRPGASGITTPRNEEDKVVILSGVVSDEGALFISTGTPIGFQLANKDAKSEDYSHLINAYRPSHADYTYDVKYGLRDIRGGGRASARETACRVVGGEIARQLFKATDSVEISAYVERVQDISVPFPPAFFSRAIVDANIVRCPSSEVASRMIKRIETVRDEGDTVGGAIVVVVTHAPAGWGEPVFDKLHADLAKALMSIPAVKALEIGAGYSGTMMKGSEHNDEIVSGKDNGDDGGVINTSSNRSGGIQGGISNGEEIVIRVGFKPVSTIKKTQNTVNRDGEEIKLSGKGRHDPCVLPRAIPIVEAMVALVLADHSLRQRTSRL